MQLLFADPELQNIAESSLRADAHFGRRDASLLRIRLCELAAAGNLAIAATVPTLGFESLPNQGGAFQFRLSQRFRVVFELAAARPRTPGVDIDLAKVDIIRIVAIE